MLKIRRLVLSLTLVSSLIFGLSVSMFSSPAQALGGGAAVIATGTLIGSSGLVALFGSSVAAISGYGLYDLYLFDTRSTYDVPRQSVRNFALGFTFFFVAGVLALDEQRGIVQVAELDAPMERMLGLTMEERVAFNAERGHFNALLNQVEQEQAAEGLSNEATHKRFVELTTQELSTGALAAYNKLKGALQARPTTAAP